jgi:hypothetical protein
MKKRIRSVAIAAIAAALTVAGLSVAQDDGGTGTGGKAKSGQRPPGPPPGGPGMLGPGGDKSLTYSETHLREDGEDVTVRVDKGKVVEADSDSIEIKRNDGETVEVAVDGDTRVMAGPRKRNAKVEDIAVGKTVIVVRKGDDEAAEAVGVQPKKRLHFRGAPGMPPPGPGGERMPPPPSSGEEG